MSDVSSRRRQARMRSAVPWIVLGMALVLATEPAWRIPLLGFAPTLDDLLSARCLDALR